jgi:hypothetical protein
MRVPAFAQRCKPSKGEIAVALEPHGLNTQRSASRSACSGQSKKIIDVSSWNSRRTSGVPFPQVQHGRLETTNTAVHSQPSCLRAVGVASLQPQLLRTSSASKVRPNLSLKRTRNGIAVWPSSAGGFAPLCACRPARNAVSRRLAPTLGVVRHLQWRVNKVSALRRALNSHEAAKPQTPGFSAC